MPAGRGPSDVGEMGRKARRTLETAILLLEKGRIDDAANRLYYAAFQAAVHGLERRGFAAGDFRPGATKWSHRTILEEVARIRDREEDRNLLMTLKHLRTTADYTPESVSRKRLEYLRRETERLVREVTS